MSDETIGVQLKERAGGTLAVVWDRFWGWLKENSAYASTSWNSYADAKVETQKAVAGKLEGERRKLDAEADLISARADEIRANTAIRLRAAEFAFELTRSGSTVPADPETAAATAIARLRAAEETLKRLGMPLTIAVSEDGAPPTLAAGSAEAIGEALPDPGGDAA